MEPGVAFEKARSAPQRCARQPRLQRGSGRIQRRADQGNCGKKRALWDQIGVAAAVTGHKRNRLLRPLSSAATFPTSGRAVGHYNERWLTNSPAKATLNG